MGKIVIIGLGPGDIGALTLEAVDKIKDGNKLFLRTKKHPTVRYLQQNNITFYSYDHVYENKETFDDVYEYITTDLIKNAKKYGSINYCVPGHPLVAESTVRRLLKINEKEGLELEIIPGMSFIDPVITAVGRDPIKNGLKVIDGLDISWQYVDINTDNIITQVYNRIIASEVKLKLLESYDDEYTIYVIKSAGIKGEEKVVKIPLYQLDRIEWIDYLTSIYIPKMDKIDKNTYDMNNLIDIMGKLRSEDGCKWDMKQTHKSLRQYVIEEAYEVVDAIDSEDMELLCEELGDLLLQVLFHSQIASEEGYFNILNVTSNLCNKLIYRHPHVFGKISADNLDEANMKWEEMKYNKRKNESYTERLKEIPKDLPSLMRSYKVQKKAADVGFDWHDITGAIEKVKEEFNEVMEEYKRGDVDKIEEELGDLLFAIVNVARFLNINPEIALNEATKKFIKRFEYMELKSKEIGKNLKDMTLEEMEKLWEMAKIDNNKKMIKNITKKKDFT